MAATVSTPGHASTLYNSNVFMTQKSKLGKENHRAAKAEEQRLAREAAARADWLAAEESAPEKATAEQASSKVILAVQAAVELDHVHASNCL